MRETVRGGELDGVDHCDGRARHSSLQHSQLNQNELGSMDDAEVEGVHLLLL